MIHTETMLTCDYLLCESWTVPTDLVGWSITPDGDLLCATHRDVPFPRLGRDPIKHFPPPEPGTIVHARS